MWPRWVGQMVPPFKGPAQVIKQVCIYGIKVSFWGSGTLKIVIPVENHPQKRSFWLADYHPLCVGGLISGHNIYTYHMYTYRG